MFISHRRSLQQSLRGHRRHPSMYSCPAAKVKITELWFYHCGISNELHADKLCPLCFQIISNVNQPAPTKPQYHWGRSRPQSADATDPRLTTTRSPVIHPNLLQRLLGVLKSGLADGQGPAKGVNLQREHCTWTLTLKSMLKNLQHGGQKNRNMAPKSLQWESRGESGLSQHPQNLVLWTVHCHRISHQMMGCPLGEQSRGMERTGREARIHSQATYQRTAGRSWEKEPEWQKVERLHKQQNINKAKVPRSHNTQSLYLSQHNPARNRRPTKETHWIHKSKMKTSGPRQSLWSSKSRFCENETKNEEVQFLQN